MNTITNLIQEIKQLRGTTVLEFGQKREVAQTVNTVIIDTVDVLEAFLGYEAELVKVEYDEIEDDYTESVIDSGDQDSDINQFLDYLENNYELKEVQTSNTYNWSAPVSNHINYQIFECKELDKFFVYLMAHRGYGDVRGNYTENVLLEFDNEYTFLELLSIADKYESITIDGICYDIDIRLGSDCQEVFVDGESIGTGYGDSLEEIVQEALR